MILLNDFTNIGVLAEICSSKMFPLIFGFNSGETEIFSVDHDSSTGFLYLAGTSTASELKASGSTKSVFTALHDG